MNALATLLFLSNAIALLALPRKWAALPLLIGCCYLTQHQGITVGPIWLPVIRMLYCVAFLRVLIRGEWPIGGFNRIDKWMLLLSSWLFISSFAHEGYGAGPLYMAGWIFNIFLSYFLIRIFFFEPDSLVTLCKIIAILLAPVALEMAQEIITGKNIFASLFGGSEEVAVRNERYRARGPFRHAILAGTVGASCVPLMLAIWWSDRKFALLGLVSCVLMVLCSASSGPIITLAAGASALLLWRRQHWVPRLRYAAVGLYLLLELVMSRPAYYVISKIDLTGGSTGYHRSRLIEAAIDHIEEWWLFGTDYTRHWMPTGVTWSSNHTDITNYYIQFGVWAGLPAIILVLIVFWSAFRSIGAILKTEVAPSEQRRWSIWCLGSALFAHMVTALSVMYYDQSFLFFWLTLGLVSSFYSSFLLIMQIPAVGRDASSSSDQGASPSLSIV